MNQFLLMSRNWKYSYKKNLCLPAISSKLLIFSKQVLDPSTKNLWNREMPCTQS